MSNPLLLPEIVASVIDNVHLVPDLLNCACVNHIWNVAALKKLYKGSLNDMQFRTPDIGSLNCLFVASRKRFARNMSFVKDLLISPKRPVIDELALPIKRLVCNEECCMLRHLNDAELLLRPQGRGLASLVIPFRIMGQDWPLNIRDLLLTPTIEYLAIDNYHCDDVIGSFRYSKITPSDKFSNLKALTVYKSRGDIYFLCKLLESCDLQFFHLEEQSESLTQSDAAPLLSRLQRHQNLKALALIVRHSSLPLESTSAWPRLKAVYLATGDQHWLEQLPKFDELQILSLQNLALNSPIMDQNAIEYIAKCRHLRVIDLHSLELDDTEALLDIARSCPLLQKFSVTRLHLRGGHNLEELLFNLLRALPQLEFLALDLKFQMNGAKLRDLAHHCPRLVVLDLPQTQLCLSRAIMTNLDPLWHLESMSFEKVYFKDPQHLMQSNNFKSLAAEWRRIFPRLRELPCPYDAHSLYTSQDDLSQESDGAHASAGADEEMSLSEPGLDFPGLDFDDYDTDWYNLRTVLWKFLGYDKYENDRGKIQYMWQTDLEIEAIGWPVVPLAAFCDPELHSTTAKPFQYMEV
ncbi:hypothetical protein CDV55_106198 [Aspergillus turcosus]|nr:hypothetical protein CDV55_106198 [Aspergillus turcosus]